MPWLREWFAEPASVFLARGQRYDGPLEQTIADGLIATGVEPAALRGRKVLLKPNLVEPSRLAPHVTTHPAMIVAAAEVFRRWGAEVAVGEAPGHLRDTELALVESGLAEVLEAADLPFRDLNYEDSIWTKNLGRTSKLAGFYFPRSVAEADLIVSMPKLKTHHWVGLTVSLKNMYGVLPGLEYGWPKNVLHQAGIPETVCDIAGQDDCHRGRHLVHGRGRPDHGQAKTSGAGRRRRQFDGRGRHLCPRHRAGTETC
jgi:uncharacterized protein (DUF362 family)